MYKPLTPVEYQKLDKMRIDLEKIMSDSWLCQSTNVLSVYRLVMEQIVYETDPFLKSSVYSVPGVIPPIQ